MPKSDYPHGADLILDELMDLTLYQELHKTARGDLKKLLGELIPVEEVHFSFWKKFFELDLNELDLKRRVKLNVLLMVCRIFGVTAIHLTLEAIEIYGIRKYLAVWRTYRDKPLGAAIHNVLIDEFEHEDSIVSKQVQRKINPERIRGIFLGFNDGLVEILGAVSGFFAAFSQPSMVLMASSSVAVAGAISMAAGAFVASGSEDEVRQIELGKARFLGKSPSKTGEGDDPFKAAAIVGVSYVIGALVPVLPVIFGATSILASFIWAGIMIALVSLILSFLSGMDAKKRILTNLGILAVAVSVTYAIGMAAKSIWGIDI